MGRRPPPSCAQEKKLHVHHGALLAQPVQQHLLSHSCRTSSHILLLQSLCERGQVQAATDALSHIHFPLPTPMYISLLQASIKSKSLSLAVHTRVHLTLNRVPVTDFLGDYLVMTLAKCGAVDDARSLSASLPRLTVFSWTAIISAYADLDRGEEALEVYQYMLKDGIKPDSFTFVSLFKACGTIPDINQGKAMHMHAHSKGLATHKIVGNTIVGMYGKCGALLDAEDVFSALTDRDTVSWNGMISAYVEQGQGEKGLLLYRQMHEEGMIVDRATFVIALQACVTLAEEEDAPKLSKGALYEIGRALHADARKKDFDTHFLVGTAILSLYAHCGTFVEAECIFSMLSSRDGIAWNAMLSVYVEQEQAEKALCLYKHMQEEGVPPDLLTYLTAVQACGVLGEKAENSFDVRSATSRCLEIGQALHSELRSKGHTTHICIANTLLSMYGKCGALAEAEAAFGEIIERDIISWNAMLSAYCEQGQEEKALSLFKVMQAQQVSASHVTLLCVLQAGGEVGDLEACRNINFSILYAGLDRMPSLTATLVNAYGSSAIMVDAEAVFDSLAEPTVVVWNACIAGHTGDKTSLGSLHMLENMRLAGFAPDKVTYTSLLSACSHSGLVVECLEYLSDDSGRMMQGIKHYNTIIDMFGRAGDFKRLMSYFEKFKLQADWITWSNLLGACSGHGNLELAKHAFEQAVRTEPKEGSVYVLMSNIYADPGLES